MKSLFYDFSKLFPFYPTQTAYDFVAELEAAKSKLSGHKFALFGLGDSVFKASYQGAPIRVEKVG